MSIPVRYRHTDLVLIRATTDPGDLDPPTHLDLSQPAAIEQEGRAWLTKVWTRDEIRQALKLASPDLAATIDRLLDADAGPATVKQLRRAVLSVASYLLRWQRRPTPFGMFAGVCTVALGPAAAQLGGRHRIVARPAGGWLTHLINEVERHPRLRPRLLVTANSGRVDRDGRLIISLPADVGVRGHAPLREVVVEHTAVVRAVMTAAAAPIRVDALADALAARFPAAMPEKILALLNNLIDQHFLITNLRPPTTSPDGLTHLIHALRAAGGEDLPDVAELLQRLDEINDLLACHNTSSDPTRAAALRAFASVSMTALAPETSQVLAADVRLDARITIPEQVLAEAALAAGVLLRLSTQPFGSTAWLDYHARFRTRYGPGALIPVRELVADSGLGYPSGYLGAPRTRPAWRELTERDAAILAFIQRAILDGAQEIELTDADVEALTVGEHADIVAPQRIELGVALHAASTDAIDRGVFELRVVAAPRVPTSMAGRFAHLLDHQERALLAATFETGARATEADEPVAVQLSFPPRRPHDEHVVRVPRLLPDVVSLAEHPDADNIDIEDLAVTADGDQMYLVQLSTGRRVIPRIPHALELGAHTPPLARFIAEVADARTATFGPFNPGAARTLPYIPRIRYRRTVLAAARWTLNSTDLPSPSHQPLAESLASWRRRWRVPARVILCHGELRLPLDLDQPLDRTLLHARLNRAERVELQEDSPQGAQDWIGRPAELLIPMTAIDPPARPLPRTAPPGSVMRAGNSLVVHAHLVGNPARFDAILTRHLPAFAHTLADTVELWWMRRHRDMIHPHADQHLALLFRLNSPDQYGPVAARIAAFAAELEARGLPAQLTLAPYPLHPARYGEGPAMAAAERVLAARAASTPAGPGSPRQPSVR
ncbi:lantibiotic dehydratase [Micromonospora sp. HM5-17]|uniref:lantibiotic dehydratase n=1 Tax=Micromonospora sp. HM5-17 TaxID=2487710 RepID=UPI000F48C808|nr:lantibiotic dehydratase [Micromonospora sp. HM5-17]ROT34274.1 lantibiotic dehydratase [Micromonospora sp. HM5-17]